MLKLIHFGATQATIQNKIDRGYKCLFDTDSEMIRFKRPMEKLETDDKESEQNTAKIKEEAEKKASSENDNSRDKNEEMSCRLLHYVYNKRCLPMY